MLNNYLKRFKVAQEVVLATIVGEEKSKLVLSEQNKKMDNYKQQLENNKTFTFSSLRHTTKH